MTTKTFFKLSLPAPILLPLALGFPDGFFGSGGFIGWITTWSLFLGGPSYVVFAIALFIMLHRAKTAANAESLITLAPIYFVPFETIGVIATFLVLGFYVPPGEGWLWQLMALAGTAMLCDIFAVMVGYSYVAPVLILYQLFKKVGLISDTAP